MKKIILYSLILGAMLTTAGVVVAAGTEKAGDESSRYLIKSNNGVLKMMYGVNHKFDNGFTTELSKGQLKFLDKLGVEMEEVGIILFQQDHIVETESVIQYLKMLTIVKWIVEFHQNQDVAMEFAKVMKP